MIARMASCPNCGGSGHFRTKKGWVTCLACNGTGQKGSGVGAR